MLPPNDILWQPPKLNKCNLSTYCEWLRERFGLRFSEYEELYRWSIDEIADFWSSIAEYFEVHFYESPKKILEGTRPSGAHWFPGAKLNYAGHLLEKLRQRASEPAILFREEPEEKLKRRVLSGGEVIDQVARLASSLKKAGVLPGDRVAGFLPNRPETVIAFLATASLGAIWSNSPPELAAKAVLDRLVQIDPKILFGVTDYRYGGKEFDRSSVLTEIIQGLPNLKHLVVAQSAKLDGNFAVPTSTFEDWISEPAEIECLPVAFEHPLWILYSSGTTGAPKPIVHGHGGILLEHLKALAFHLDLGPGDRFFWFTTAGWMMWNFNVSGLALGNCIVLYDGSPKYPDFSVLWRLLEEEGVTYFGTSAPYLLACQKEGVRPGTLFRLEALRGLGSTGAPLTPEGFDWVYQEVKNDVWLGSLSGGTDVCTAFVLGNPMLPVIRGKLQCRGLGARIEAWDEEGRPVKDSVGELVLTAPLPCMPVCFWNDPDGKKLRASYFEYFPGYWRHGDWIDIDSKTGQCTIYGRSDATLNRGGVRMGTSEFYRVVEALPEVVEALVVDTTGLQPAGVEGTTSGTAGHRLPSDCREVTTSHLAKGGRLYLFVVVRGQMDSALKDRICTAIRSDLSPRYVPDEIFPVSEIPHTANGKKLEVPIKKLFLGKPLHEVASRDSVANPASLEEFSQIAARLSKVL